MCPCRCYIGINRADRCLVNSRQLVEFGFRSTNFAEQRVKEPPISLLSIFPSSPPPLPPFSSSKKILIGWMDGWEKILKERFSPKIFRFIPLKGNGDGNYRSRTRPRFCQQSFRSRRSVRGRAASQFTLHTPDSIYRSYNVFEPEVPFVSAVRALIIPRTFLPPPFSFLFLFFSFLHLPKAATRVCVYIYIYSSSVRARCIVSSQVPRRSDCCRVSR